MSRIRFNRPCSRIRSSAGVTSSSSCFIFFSATNAAGILSARPMTGAAHNSERRDLSTGASMKISPTQGYSHAGQRCPYEKDPNGGLQFSATETSNGSAQIVLVYTSRYDCRIRGGGNADRADQGVRGADAEVAAARSGACA